MSEFFRALGQADRDRALREQGGGRPLQAEPPAPVAAPVEEEALTPPVTATAPTPVRLRRETRPDPSDIGAEELDGHLVSLVTPATFEAEQYRALRHMIEEQHAVSGMSVVAVSSPAVGDGKTTTAINLAGALAQCPGARVLLIEADLRRASVAQHMGLHAQPSPGLVGMLVDRKLTLAATVRQRPPFKLDILPAGDTPSAPYELLRSGNLAELMKQARSHYNYVVVDAPPLVGIPDCRVLASFVDGFVIVVAAHRTPKRLVEEAVAVVEPTKMIGLVFNMDERPFAGHYLRHAAATTNGNGDGNGHRKWPWDWQRAWKS